MTPSTETLRKRFCNDTGLQINVMSDSYFRQRLDLFDATDAYEDYLDMTHRYTDKDKSYLDYYDSVWENAVEYIKSSNTFELFNTTDMCAYTNITYKNIPSGDVYKQPNVGKTYISIDMVKANFTCLVHFERKTPFGKQIETDGYDYGSFMHRFTDNDFIIKSKNIRQIIFGKCNTNRFTTYQKYMMSTVINALIEIGVKLEDICSLRNDEIIIQMPTDSDLIDKIVSVANNTCFPLRTETFTLEQILDYADPDSFPEGRIVGYIKRFDDKTFETKCVSAVDAAPVTRFLKGEAILDTDLVFQHEKRLAKFITTPQYHIIKSYE